MAIELTEAQARFVLDSVRAMALSLHQAGQPLPENMHTLIRFLSARGPNSGDWSATEIPLAKDLDDPIGTEEAAAILEYDTRHVRRLAPKLGGRQTSGRWIFNRHNVIQYANQRGAT